MEIFYVIFLLSGQFKSFLEFFGFDLPIDLTLVCAVAVVGLTIYKLQKTNHFTTRLVSFNSIAGLLLFFAWMVFTLFYTASQTYSSDKTFYFLLNIIAFSVPFVYKGFDVRRFLKLISFGIIILALGLLPFQFFDLLESSKEMTEDGSFSAIGGLYLTLSEYLGLIVVLFMTKHQKFIFSRTVDILIIITAISLMGLLGARGPVIFALGVWVLYYLNSIEAIRLSVKLKSIRKICFGAFGLVIVLFLMTQFQATQTLLSRSIYRFAYLAQSVFVEGGQDNSSSVRIDLIRDAVGGIFINLKAFFFGHGIGSFGIVTQELDVRMYPHNMILEIWFEMGMIGLGIFVSWIVYLLLKARQLPNKLISYWLLLYVFLNLMKSSSLIDIRVEFAILGLFLVQNFSFSKEEKLSFA